MKKIAQAAPGQAVPPVPPALPPLGGPAPAMDPSTGLPVGAVAPQGGMPGLGDMTAVPAGIPSMGTPQGPAPVGAPEMGGQSMGPALPPGIPPMGDTTAGAPGMPMGMPPGMSGDPNAGGQPGGDASQVVDGVDPNLPPDLQSQIMAEAGKDPEKDKKIDSLNQQIGDLGEKVNDMGQTMQALAEFFNVGRRRKVDGPGGADGNTGGDNSEETTLKVASLEDFEDGLLIAAKLRHYALEKVGGIFEGDGDPRMIKSAGLRETIEKAARSRSLRNAGRVARNIQPVEKTAAGDQKVVGGIPLEEAFADFSLVDPSTFTGHDGMYSKIAADIAGLRQDPMFARVLDQTGWTKVASSDTLIDVDMLKIDLVQASGEALSGGHEKMALDLMEAYASLEMADDLERMLEAGAPMVVTPQSGK